MNSHVTKENIVKPRKTVIYKKELNKLLQKKETKKC